MYVLVYVQRGGCFDHAMQGGNKRDGIVRQFDEKKRKRKREEKRYGRNEKKGKESET